jgi:hypothetical protein
MIHLKKQFTGEALVLKTRLSPREVLVRLQSATNGAEPFLQKGSSSAVYGVFRGNTFQLVSFAGRPTAYRRRFYGQVRPLNAGALVSGAFRLSPVVRGLLVSIVAIIWLIALTTAFQMHNPQSLAVAALAMAIGLASIYPQLARSAEGERKVRELLLNTIEAGTADDAKSQARP